MGLELARLGIVATADINRLIIPTAKVSPLVEPVVVASRDEKRASDYACKWGIERAYGSYDALLAALFLSAEERRPVQLSELDREV